MVNSILQYIEPQLKAYMQFLNRVDSPVFRISTGDMIKGNGQEKEVVTISDLNGNSLYIRQTQPETINERKALSSCDKEYNISARCKVVFYSFGGNDFTINPDKVKSKIINTLARLDFSHYTGSSTEIKIDINGNSLDMEKIYTEETGKEFSGNVWPTLVSVDFTLSYVDTNCNNCDIDDNEPVITWTPDLTPENCQKKAICEAVESCDIIQNILTNIENIQDLLNNLPPGFSCEDLPECQAIVELNQSVSSLTTDTQQLHDALNNLGNYVQGIENNLNSLSQDVQSIQNDLTTINQSLQDLNTAISNHINDTSNPHQTSLQQVIDVNATVHGVIAQSNDGLTNISVDNDVSAMSSSAVSGVDYSQVSVTSTKITSETTLNSRVTKQEIIDGQIENTTDLLTYNGNEVATQNFVDARIQSNIKIIGDWDATSGSMPLADESNTTPFITQWGSTIKVGWAFRVGYGQAGTVGGFEYEEGDVVYALIDNAGPTPADWGDLDHNLQQATESLRGTAKVITAAIIADENTLDDEKFVTGKKLWLNFWTRVLAIAHTFAAKITFTSAPRFNSTTANQRLEVDANKDLVSVAKGTADNANYGITAGTVLEGNRITQTITDGVTDKVPSEDAVYDALALKLTKNNFVDIVSSCVFVGWSSYTTQSVRAVDMGDYYIVTGYVVGTSNSATTTIQLPYTNNGHRQGYSGYGVGGGTSIFTRVVINGASDTIDFRTGAAGSAWATTGTKEVNFNLIIEK